jgi:hypothetical protein
MCVRSLSYPAFKAAHAPYYLFICGLFGSTKYFPHFIIKGTIFGKKKLGRGQTVAFSNFAKAPRKER